MIGDIIEIERAKVAIPKIAKKNVSCSCLLDRTSQTDSNSAGSPVIYRRIVATNWMWQLWGSVTSRTSEEGRSSKGDTKFASI